jgi:hypothetical protein
MRVFVNEQSLALPDGADAGAAVEALDPELAARVAEGSAYLTDGRGVRLAPDAALSPGAIIRVVRSARRAGGDGDHADA